MRTLVIYDSFFGNTEQVARKIASHLDSHGVVRLVPAEHAGPLDAADADLLVIGCPTQKHNITLALHALLDDLSPRSLNGVMAVTFDTRYRMPIIVSGSASHTIAKKLRKAGAVIIVPPESFYVDAKEGPLGEGELQRAARWADTVLEKFESITSPVATR